MNKPSRDRFFPTRSTCYSLKLTGEGVEPKKTKIAIALIDFQKVDRIEDKDGKTWIYMGDSILEIDSDFIIIRNAYMVYKKSL